MCVCLDYAYIHILYIITHTVKEVFILVQLFYPVRYLAGVSLYAYYVRLVITVSAIFTKRKYSVSLRELSLVQFHQRNNIKCYYILTAAIYL